MKHQLITRPLSDFSTSELWSMCDQGLLAEEAVEQEIARRLDSSTSPQARD
jgi:hypothetical protein